MSLTTGSDDRVAAGSIRKGAFQGANVLKSLQMQASCFHFLRAWSLFVAAHTTLEPSDAPRASLMVNSGFVLGSAI
jgi:hypothetical protein